VTPAGRIGIDDGEFAAQLPVGTRCTLKVTDSAFVETTRDIQVSRVQNERIVVRLRAAAHRPEPDTETIARFCHCGDDLFVHDGR